MKISGFFLLIFLSVFLTSELYSLDCTPPDCTKTELKKGIVWYHKVYTNLLGGPQNVNIIDIDNSDPHITIKPVYKASSSCEKASSMGKRTSAVAGINGGFFDSANNCSSLSLLKIDNKVISYAVSTRPARSALGIRPDKTILFRRTDSKDSFPEAFHALGGTPNLVKDGNLYVTTSEEEADSIAGVNPRTAICKTSNNHFMMITVDGRATGRTGMTLDNLAQYLLWLGCSDGINLDGGGSTTMWVSTNGVVNYPSDGSERSISSGLFVYYTDNLPPVIEHTPVLKSEKTDILITAKVTDDTGLKAVNLKFRNKGDTDFISRNMTDKGNNIYEAFIYSQDIKTGMIQYYIAAWDGELRTLLPSDAETGSHYFEIQITVNTDAGYELIDDGESLADISADSDISFYDVVDNDDTVNELTDSVNIYDIDNSDFVLYDVVVADTDSDLVTLTDTDTVEDVFDTYPADTLLTDVVQIKDASAYPDNNAASDIISGPEEEISGCSCALIE